jgi:hypothetical protein
MFHNRSPYPRLYPRKYVEAYWKPTFRFHNVFVIVTAFLSVKRTEINSTLVSYSTMSFFVTYNFIIESDFEVTAKKGDKWHTPVQFLYYTAA